MTAMPDTINVNGVQYRRTDRQANRVSCWAMYDCHAFQKLEGSSVDEVIDHWLRLCDNPDEYGKPSLCPIIVLTDDKELRRVGPMVFPDGGHRPTHQVAADLQKFKQAALADPDISRILATTIKSTDSRNE